MKETAFRLTLNTHSVDLDRYDIQKLSFLQIDGGISQPAVKWVPSGAGHHLQGVLSFAEELPDGKHQVQLVVRDIDDVKERIFEWQIPIEN